MKRTLQLAAALFAVLSGAHAQTSLPARSISFAVSTVKPSKPRADRIGFNYNPFGVSIENVTLESIIRAAYLLQDGQLLNLPDWATHTNYDIEAKVADEDRDTLKKLSTPERAAMLQVLLAERFHLKTHPETRDLPVLQLVLARGGAKLTLANRGADPDSKADHGIRFNRGDLHATDSAMEPFVKLLAQLTHHLVLDRTALTGHYDFDLTYTDENTPPSAESSAPSLYTALQEQLGLKLDATKAPMAVLVVDSIDQPTAD